MKFSAILAAFALAALSSAHSTVYSIQVNGKDQGDSHLTDGYIRSPPNNNPVKDITSTNLTCNVANNPAPKTVTAAAGDQIGVVWHHNDATASDDIIASSHKGPLIVYIAPTASNGAGPVWVKIAQTGYAAGTWAVDTLIANKGLYTFTLPSAIAPGDYLLRPEIIALHEADVSYASNPARGAQLYMECIQLTVTGSGTTLTIPPTLPAGIALPGEYKETDPGIVFNLYGTFTEYTIPGGPLSDLAAGGAGGGGNTTGPAPTSGTDAPASSSVAAPVPTSSAAGDAPAAGGSGASTVTVYQCSSSMAAGTNAAPTTVPTGTTVAAVDGSVAKYGQCGGKGFTGSTGCISGTTCKVINDYYSQCLAA